MIAGNTGCGPAVRASATDESRDTVVSLNERRLLKTAGTCGPTRQPAPRQRCRHDNVAIAESDDEQTADVSCTDCGRAWKAVRVEGSCA